MSVLVWDGHRIAVDSMANTGTHSFPLEKVWRLPATTKQPAMLAGVVGQVQVCADLREWADNGRQIDKFPESASHNLAQLVLVSKEKGLIRYYGSCIPILHGLNKVAIGEGAPVAYGALYMGATAEQAVAAAIQYNPSCNGVPEVFEL